MDGRRRGSPQQRRQRGHVIAVFVDWGTTNVRGWRVDAAGHVIDRHSSGMGLRSAAPAGFARVLGEILDDLKAESDAPTILCGMVGSKQGWHEAPYSPTPADSAAIGRRATRLSERPDTWIVGGICCGVESGRPEVARGEEVQALGVLELHSDAESICLPGTHSKWLSTKRRQIIGIETHMTGELFELITRHSILSQQMTSADLDEEAFVRGVDLAKASPGLANGLFQVRTRWLFGQLDGDEAHSFASGYLIGSEVREAQRTHSSAGPVYLCGSTQMNRLYALGLSHLGTQCVSVDSERATLSGFQTLMPYLGHG